MNYCHQSTGQIVTRAYMDYLGLPQDNGDLLRLGYYPVVYDRPNFDSRTQQAIPDGAPVKDGDIFIQHFRIEPLDEAAIAANLEAHKQQALAKLKTEWRRAEDSGVVHSSAGFVIDATARADRDIAGLITTLESGGQSETEFCAADNTMHTVTLEQLRAMRLEIIQFTQSLYAWKWRTREAILAAENFAAVDAVGVCYENSHRKISKAIQVLLHCNIRIFYK